MTQYLETKYGKRFVVKDVHVEGSGLGVKGQITGDVSPRDNPNLNFRIWRPENGSLSYTDRYLETLWSQQGRAIVDRHLKDILPNVDGYILTIGPSNNLYAMIKGTTPDLSEVLNNHSKE